MAKEPIVTAVGKVVRLLRQRALATPEGQMIGSEDELVAAYAVSRPTLRQAAALVGQEQLLAVRRGVGGGYFSRRPETEAVAHIAAIYLQSRRTRLEEIIRAIEPIRIEMCRLAAQNRDHDILQEWRDCAEREASAGPEITYREFLRFERDYSRILARASKNQVLELFLFTLYEFCGYLNQDEDVFRGHPERVSEYWKTRKFLIQAILDGDQEYALVSAGRCARLITDWMVADVQTRSGPDLPGG